MREPGNPFDPSCVKGGLSRDSCVYTFLGAKVALIINPLLENPV